MSKFKVVNIIDLVFVTIVIFLLVFIWMQFFIGGIALPLILSAIVTLSAMLIKRHFANRKSNSKTSLMNYQIELSKFKLAIQTLSSSKLNTLLKQILPNNSIAKIEKGNVVFSLDNKTYIISTFFKQELTENNLLDIIKNTTYSNIIIICANINIQASQTCKAFRDRYIELITIEQLYNLFTSHNISLDTSSINLATAKLTLKDIAKTIVSRNKSKGCFITSLILLFSSILVPFKIYYLVTSSILLILSIVCRLKPVYNATNSILK